MKIIDVKNIRDGEILASPIYSEDKNILIPKGAVLKSEYSDLLISLNIEYVEIEDKYYPYVSPVLLVDGKEKECFVTDIQKLLEYHIYTGKQTLKNSIYLAKAMKEYADTMNLNSVYDIFSQDESLYEHTLRVTLLSLMLARKLELPESDCISIAIGCILHDLGLRYITVPFVNKDFEKSEPADVFEYKKHTILAYTVLESEEWLPKISKKMILSHHEKANGLGFPLKQKDQEIECKIIQLCDTFDCLISGIECKRVSIEAAIDYIWSEADHKYDRSLIEALFPMIAKYPAGAELELSDGRYAVVSRQTDDSDRPVIMILTKLDGEIIPEKEYNLKENKNIYIKRVV